MVQLTGRDVGAVLEAVPDAVVAVDPGGRIVFANQQAAVLFGWPPAELIGQRVEVLVPVEARAVHPGHRARYHAAPAPRAMGAGDELAARRRDGTTFPAEISLSAVDTVEGQLVIASIRDVTERRRADATFRALLEAAPDAMVCVDTLGHIRLVNARAESLFGYRREELVGAPIEVLVPEAARGRHPGHRSDYFDDPRPRPMGAGHQLAGRRRDGSEFPAEISLSALEVDGGLLVSAAIRDVTERLEAEAERERLRSQAERERVERERHQRQRLESLGQLAGGVAHDFNNLLGAITNYTHFVATEVALAAGGDVARPWATVQRDVQQIQLGTDRASSLVRQLLAFARREVVHPQVLDLNEVVGALEPLLARTIGEHVELSVHLEPTLAATLGDRSQLEQVLVNLTVNARDAMPQGGSLRITTATVRVGAEEAAGELEPGRYVRLQVDDTGTGMSPEVLERLFEPFFTTKPSGEGTGLGLATVYGIVAQAGGRTEVRSALGQGTSVAVLLPVSERAQPDAGPAAPVPARGHETVLVVEDDDLMREVTGRILRGEGYVVVEAADGPAALRAEAEHAGPIDLVLTDVVMPRMLGPDLAAQLVTRRPGVRVLFMSGYAQGVLGPGGTVSDDLRLVDKPFTADVLLDAVRGVLDERVGR